MSRVDSHVAAVQRKLAFSGFLYWLALASFVALVGVVLTTVIQRAIHFALPAPATWIGGALASVVGVFAITMALLRRPTAESAAVAIDERLGLKEKFSTALSVRRMNDPFAHAVVMDAEQTANSVRITGQFPLSFPKWAWWAIATGLLAFALIRWMPEFDLLGKKAKLEAKRAEEVKIANVQQIVKEALAKIEAVPQSKLGDNEKVQLAKRNLTELLNNHKMTDPEKAARLAAEAQQGLADALKSKIAENKEFQQAQEMKNMFRSAMNPPMEAKGPVAKAHRDLARGDFEEAKNEIERLSKEFDKLPEKEKEKAAEQMKNMAQQLQQVAQDPRVQEKIAQQMQQMGANQQQIQQLQQQIQKASQGDQQAQQQLQQQAQQLAQQLGQGMNQQQQQAMQQAMQKAVQQAQQGANAQQQAANMQQAAQQMAQAMQQIAQNGQNGQNAQNQPNGQNGQGQQQAQQQMQQGAQQMANAIGQAQQQQADAQALKDLAQAMQNGANQAGGQANPGMQPGQGQQGQGQWQPGDPAGQQGQGQGQAGIGAGGRGDKAVSPFGVKVEVSAGKYDKDGKHLASIYVKDRSIKGESKAALKEALQVGQADEGDEVDDSQPNQRSREIQKKYFKVMEDELKKAK